MFDTDSVFNVLAADDSDRRVASRRALALAHTRVDNALGAYLKGAVTKDDFESRLAQVQDELTAHVALACEESGHDKPEFITASLIDNYRVNRRWQPRQAAPMGPFGRQDENLQYVDPTQGGLFPTELSGQYPQQAINPQQIDPATGRPMQPGYQAVPAEDPNQGMGAIGDMYNDDPYSGAEYENGERNFDDWGGYQDPRRAAYNPSDQKDNADKQVACPECGGSKKTANGEPCPRCGGKGTVRNFGNSVLDSVAHVAGEGNTNLGEPEPKMDKRKWTPETVGDPDPGSTMNPNRHKDPLQVIPAANRAEPGHELTEIGEQTTVTEDLPAAQGDDSGFSTEVPEGRAPHTKTFPKGDQATPVTREAIN